MWPNLNGFVSSASFTDTTRREKRHAPIQAKPEEWEKKSFARSRFILKRMTDKIALFFCSSIQIRRSLNSKLNVRNMWTDRGPSRNQKASKKYTHITLKWAIIIWNRFECRSSKGSTLLRCAIWNKSDQNGSDNITVEMPACGLVEPRPYRSSPVSHLFRQIKEKKFISFCVFFLPSSLISIAEKWKWICAQLHSHILTLVAHSELRSCRIARNIQK